MSDRYIEYVEELLDHEGRTGVTEQYQETIEMFVTMAENRSVPVPLAHIVAYEDDSSHDMVIFLFIVDVNEEYFGEQVYSFELAAHPKRLQSIENDTEQEFPDDRSLLDEYSMMLRRVQEAIWEDAVNLDWGDDNGDE